ncbi:hypothetical protein EDC04DRAFT_2681315 [Pisolithus marmoratus]|nr:hypothetical protein EDC04DRAFT_2681315 [Pisolithus marmoratus]
MMGVIRRGAGGNDSSTAQLHLADKAPSTATFVNGDNLPKLRNPFAALKDKHYAILLSYGPDGKDICQIPCLAALSNGREPNIGETYVNITVTLLARESKSSFNTAEGPIQLSEVSNKRGHPSGLRPASWTQASLLPYGAPTRRLQRNGAHWAVVERRSKTHKNVKLVLEVHHADSWRASPELDVLRRHLSTLRPANVQ